ncbi:DISARM system phospholipase D-like protein DrmC [Micromonospora aurantiaca]|uniref:DISARM system phospholipase D-like protein DrmC n=1 Tax=Micromonospora aurantiaca (nom. illeg.) TaxID=47850 RepID=UPI0034090108
MSWHPAFQAAAEAAVNRLGPAHLRVFADRLAAGEPDQALRHAVPVPGFADAAAAVLAAQHADGVPGMEAAAYLRGLAAGHAQRSAEVRIESVWSGPSTHPVPVRSTAQVLVGLVEQARSELLLMTYSARPYPPLVDSLIAAVRRQVSVTVVVETLAGAGGAMQGPEPAAAFAAVPGIHIWQWPTAQRTTDRAKMHAKIAIADRRVLLVSSANLTQSGVNLNIEAGLLVHGGTAPRRAAEHIAELQSRGVLTRLRSTGQEW